MNQTVSIILRSSYGQTTCLPQKHTFWSLRLCFLYFVACSSHMDHRPAMLNPNLTLHASRHEDVFNLILPAGSDPLKGQGDRPGAPRQTTTCVNPTILTSPQTEGIPNHRFRSSHDAFLVVCFLFVCFTRSPAMGSDSLRFWNPSSFLRWWFFLHHAKPVLPPLKPGFILAASSRASMLRQR